ncbi:CLUMA_CG000049, isoform A [Clunio marinus]|uniref:CLUMA_CG000049, isoform A n=1 Tax=Clunio marinus TaxID=568069 RepID=A0A1J1HF16_9DIPT|nr:CLUMA_CG000049, isoform A [Clunio marinus]
MNTDTEKITFRSIKQQNLRKRRKSISEVEQDNEIVEGDSINHDLINETKAKQKLRTRQNGVNFVTLALGKKISLEEEVSVKDPFNIQIGGMVNMQALKAGKIKTNYDDAYDTGIGTQFSAETNIGDTDEEMMKYIDEQMKKRNGITIDKDGETISKYLTPEEAALLALPAHLRECSTKKSEEMLSNQMLNGIPEVDLGIETKIKNIEATEEEKQKLISDQRRNLKDLPSQFVPKNYAVNFVQHNRFKLEQTDHPQKKHHENGDSSQNVTLALGKKISLEEEVSVKDPFNIQIGGMVNMQALKAGKIKTNYDDAYDTGIGTQFSAETNIGDTDEEMMKYIDEQMKKRNGITIDKDGETISKYLTPEEAALLALPAHLRECSTKKSEEMLSNQMLNGIPEVDLGIETKIKNIEATEEEKQKLISDQRRNLKDLPSQFVPKNYAVNFVQHNRFKLEQTDHPQKKHHENGDSSQKSKIMKKATDDYHFDKFKKQFRRH